MKKHEPIAGVRWHVCDVALGADSKIRRILRVLASGKSLNRFQAIGYHDSVLNSTISKIESKGINVSRREETVRGFEGEPVHCCRYWLEPDQRERALELLNGQAHRPAPSARVTPAHANRSPIPVAEAARRYREASGR
jgi:hypothetical protein